ncbi:MAG: hypothetical protein JKY56_04205, partial [Kofleriaceae bacterium]|nr:hypothetical protein [Kofleriaceae bacterium]
EDGNRILISIIPRDTCDETPPTQKDHLADSLAIFLEHRKSNEAFVTYGVPFALGEKVNIPPESDFVDVFDDLAEFLARKERVLAIVSRPKLCELNRAHGTHGSFAVLGDPKAPFAVLTNHLIHGERDENTYSQVVRNALPKGTGTKKHALWGDSIRFVGVDMPSSVQVGESFEVSLFFEVLKPVAKSWQTFVHFYGQGIRFQADHEVQCGTEGWRAGDWIVDTFEVQAGSVAAIYSGYIGFFTGQHGSWKNMQVTQGQSDVNNRVPIGKIVVQ